MALLGLYLAPHGSSSTTLHRISRRSPTLAYIVETVLLGTQFQTMLKIILGYGQCMSVFRRFHQVAWPSSFLVIVDVVEACVAFVSVGLEFVPMDCIMPARWSRLYSTFVVYLCLPVVGVILILAIASVRAACSREAPCQSRISWERINTPQLWNCVLWFVLFIYPMLTRQVLSVFDFIDIQVAV